MPTPIILSFSGGRLSPYLSTRVDQEKYYSGCRIMNNMIALPYGPAMRTPGWEFIAAEKTQSKKVKLFSFKYSVDQSYVLEFGHQYMRVYKGGSTGYGQVMYKILTIDAQPAGGDWSADDILTGGTSGTTCIVVAVTSSTVYTIKHLTGDFTDGEVITADDANARDCGAGYPIVTVSTTPCEISTVYTEDDLFDLHVVGMNDVMDIVHTQHTIKPYRLSRLDHDDWTIVAKDFTYGPFLDENDTNTTLYCNDVSGDGKTMTASAALFDYPDNSHIGSIWQLIQKTPTSRVKGSFVGVDQSDSIRCFGGWILTTEGDWIGDVELQRSYDGGTTWYPYHQFSRQSAAGLNYYKGEIEDEEDVYYRVAMTARTSGTCYYCFSVNDNTVKGIVKITAIASTTSATVNILVDLGNKDAGSATKRWNEGAWSDKRGYPGTIGLFQQRSIFGGSTHRPQLVWGSRTQDYENMRTGILDTHAFIYELASGNQDFIKWLIGFSEIIIGTKGAEHKLGPPSKGQKLTSLNVSQDIQSTYGGSDIQPIVGNDVVLYWGRQRRKLWELIYSWDTEAYVSRDLALYAEDITEGGIVDMAYQQQPFPIVWSIRTDGNLLGMTFLRTHKVEGWHIHPTDGNVESVAVIPSSGEDEVWFSVQRTINSVTKRYIERMKPHSWGTDQKDCFFVHSGLTFDGGAAVDITDIAVGGSPYKVTVTATAHGRTDGEQVRILDVEGMTEVNGKVFTVSDKLTDTFILKDKTNSIYITGENFTAYTSGGTAQRVENVMTGLSHLEAEEVDILADGIPLPRETVSSGQITINEFANKVHVGIPYVPELMPMNIEIPLRSGTSLAKTKRVINATINFFKSAGCEFGTDEDNIDHISFMQTSDIMGEPTPLFTGDKEIAFSGGYDTFTNLYIRQVLPLPLTVLSIIPNIALSD